MVATKTTLALVFFAGAATATPECLAKFKVDFSGYEAGEYISTIAPGKGMTILDAEGNATSDAAILALFTGVGSCSAVSRGDSDYRGFNGAGTNTRPQALAGDFDALNAAVTADADCLAAGDQPIFRTTCRYDQDLAVGEGGFTENANGLDVNKILIISGDPTDREDVGGADFVNDETFFGVTIRAPDDANFGGAISCDFSDVTDAGIFTLESAVFVDLEEEGTSNVIELMGNVDDGTMVLEAFNIQEAAELQGYTISSELDGVVVKLDLDVEDIDSVNLDFRFSSGGVTDLVFCVPAPEDCCPVDPDSGKKERPKALTFRYTGDGCVLPLANDQNGKADCSGDANDADPVRIIANHEDDPCDTDKVFFDGVVGLDDRFQLVAVDADKGLEANLWIHIFGTADAACDDAPIETIEVHGSCSRPLNTLDVFGSALLTECSGELPPPPPPGPRTVCCPCDGPDCERPSEYTFQYTATTCDASMNDQGGEFECDDTPGADLAAFEGPVYIVANDKDNACDEGKKTWFEGFVSPGEEFVLSVLNEPGEDKFGGDTRFHVYADKDNCESELQFYKIHTSCSVPIEVGDQFASGLVLECSTDPDPVPSRAPVPAPTAPPTDVKQICCPCEGDDCDPLEYTFQYTATSCDASMNDQGNKFSCEDADGADLSAIEGPVYIVANNKNDACDDTDKIWFEGFVSAGDEFTISVLNADEDKFDGDTRFHVLADKDDCESELQFFKIHTSCSKAIELGDQFASALVTECSANPDPVPTPEPTTAAPAMARTECCPCDGPDCEDPLEYTFQYTATSCDATSNDQGNKFSCTDADGADLSAIEGPVYIVANNKNDACDEGKKTWFEGFVSPGEEFSISVLNAGEDKFDGDTRFHVYAEKDNCESELQFFKLHTSCSRTIDVGDQFASALVTECTSDPDPPPTAAPVLAPTPMPTDEKQICCPCEGSDCKPTQLSFIYFPMTCATPLANPQGNKAECTDENPFPGGSSVYILATDDDDPCKNNPTVWFSDTVAVNTTFVLSVGDEDKFESNSYVYVLPDADSCETPLQSLTIHTSCSQPLVKGDIFGAAIFTDCARP